MIAIAFFIGYAAGICSTVIAAAVVLASINPERMS